jgi:hypothetical protein
MNTASSWIRLAISLAAATAALAPRSVCAGSADADALFEEGKRLMAKGEFAQACEKFEASDRIDQASGTELNLGRCRDKNGQQASAWVAYLKAAATANHEGNKKNEKVARAQAAEIHKNLVYLTIAVPEDAQVEGLVIQRNNTAVETASWNQPIPVDPDKYTITADAPGYRPWSKSVTMVKTQSKTVEVPPLEKLPEPPPAAPSRVDRSAAAGPDEPSGAREPGIGGAEAGSAPSMWTGRRKLSVLVVAFGAAAAGAGIGLGLHANHLESQSDAICSDRMCHPPEAVDLNRSARRYALAANIGFAAGGAAAVSAVMLWLFGAPRAPDSSRPGVTGMLPTCGPGCVGFTLARSF